MQLKTHLLVAIAAAMVAPVMFTACGGPECGTGTTEQDGACVPTAAPVTCDEDTELTDGKCVSTVEVVTCEEGTSLEDGKCVLADSGCGEGTSLQGGECVADDPDLSQACGEGTSFDSAAGACVADSTVTCGDNTIEEDGACVPDPAAVCATGTLPNDDGVCVIDAASCGDNTILDPNTNTCVINDAGVFCGTNTAYDAALETCVPTDSVCDAGTTFDDVTGLCLPDATCQAGDVILNGQCVSPAQEAFANADVTVDETADRVANNDDTNLGGTATALTIPAMGTAYLAAGQVNVPVDIDGDGAVDQDIDSYTITGTAGQAFRIAVQPVKGPSLGFVVRSDDGRYVRLSTQGLAPGAARQIVLPEDGTYTIDVTSSIFITGPAAPVGADDWNYVLSVEEIAGPTAMDFDTTTGPITGEFANLSDNLFRLTNFTAGELVTFNVDSTGDDVGAAYMQVWASPTQLVDTFEIGDGDTVTAALPSPDAFVFFDWGFVSGPDTSFEVSATPLDNQENAGAIAAGGTFNSGLVTQANDDIRYISFTLAAGEVAEITHTNAENGTVDLVVRSSRGVEVDDSSFNAQGATTPEYAYVYSPNGGTFIIESQANGTRTDSGFTITSKTPSDLGSYAVGGQFVETSPSALNRNQSSFHTLTLTDNVSVNGSLLGGNGETTAELTFFDASTGQELADITSSLDEINVALLTAGTYLVEVEADGGDLPDGFVLDLDFPAPPVFEVEPNDDLATAQPITIPTRIVGTGGYTGGGTTSEFAGNGVPFDFYTFTLAQDLAPNEILVIGMDSIAPVQATSLTDFTLHDSTGAPIITEDTNDSFEVTGLAAGVYYITVSLSSSTTFDTQYLLSIDLQTLPLEALGAITPIAVTSTPSDDSDGDRRVISFTLAAGEIAEIVHNNTENEDVNVSISGPDAIFTDSVFQPQGATTSERAYIYSPNGGTYSIVIEANANITSSVFTITGITSTSLGPKALGDSLDAVQAGVVPREAREFYSFSLTTDATLSGALTSNTSNNADLVFYDTVTGAEVATVTSSKDNINVNLTAGTYLMAVYADGGELDTGYSANFSVVAPPTFLDGTVGDSCAAPVVVNMSGAFTGELGDFTVTQTGRPCLTSTSNNGPDLFFSVTVPDGQTLTASALNGTDFVAYLVNSCADIGDNALCIDSDDSGNPETVTVTNTTGAPATYIFSAYAWSSFSTTGTFNITIDIQ